MAQAEEVRRNGEQHWTALNIEEAAGSAIFTGTPLGTFYPSTFFPNEKTCVDTLKTRQDSLELGFSSPSSQIKIQEITQEVQTANSTEENEEDLPFPDPKHSEIWWPK